ncbi:MAG TPA: DUF4135 domain-containing protein [Arcobacter sp.]|nr:DUF4135 domain-containing protein [Arcobacter sp.]
MINNDKLEKYIESLNINSDNIFLKKKILSECNKSNYSIDKTIYYLDFVFDVVRNMNLKINDIDLFLSDSHNFGLAVSRVRTSKNKILYIKPKSIHSSLYLNYIIRGIFNNNFLLESNIININKDFSIEEDIPFNKPLPIKNFSIACGRLLALLFFLDGRDMHLNNFTINRFGFPQIIDSETLFHNNIPRDFFSKQKDYYRENIFSKTPLILGMLPQSHTYKGITYEESGIKGLFMKISKQYNYNYIFEKNIEHIILGFELGFNEILEKKNFLLSVYPLFVTRHILRPTKFYETLIEEITLLPNKEERMYFLKNTLDFSKKRNNNYMWIVEREIEELLNFDIPIFTTSPVDTAIYIRKNKLKNFFKESSFIRLKNMIFQHSSSDVKKHIKVIKWSAI